MPAPLNILAVQTFLEAFRDAGYRGLPGALSELIDNALEAGATQVEISFLEVDGHIDRVLILDNGHGIDPTTLALALQLGGSTRFDSRDGFGRYGIGLPGASISQARRVDVFSWTRPGASWWSFLSLDEVKVRQEHTIPPPSESSPPISVPDWAEKNGTLVAWSTCDRLQALDRVSRATLHRRIGQTFRQALWAGCQIRVDGETVKPVDPLFLRAGMTPPAATAYGPPLSFAIDLIEGDLRRRAHVYASFSELPVETWTSLTNLEKRRLGISKGGGVSVLRSGREIDFGWFFMGGKRKEAYDDWWRCELTFTPELDAFFGLTHTKQGIHPRDELVAILAPDLERVAHTLNGRVRRRFQELRKNASSPSRAVTRAEQRDHLLEPPGSAIALPRETNTIRGLRYKVIYEPSNRPEFFSHRFRGDTLQLALNTDHPFYSALRRYVTEQAASDFIEILLIAAARAQCQLPSTKDRASLSRHREHWSNTLMAFLQ